MGANATLYHLVLCRSGKLLSRQTVSNPNTSCLLQRIERAIIFRAEECTSKVIAPLLPRLTILLTDNRLSISSTNLSFEILV